MQHCDPMKLPATVEVSVAAQEEQDSRQAEPRGEQMFTLGEEVRVRGTRFVVHAIRKKKVILKPVSRFGS